MHARKQIRDAFVLALSGVAGVTTFNGRVFPMYDAILPAYSVQSREEAIEIETNQGRLIGQQNRTVIVSVQGYAKVEGSIDDELDRLSELAEVAIFDDADLKVLVRCLDLATVEFEVSGEGENTMGVVTLNFSCRYLTNDGVPGVILT